MKTKLLILAIFVCSVSVFAGGSPSVADLRIENPVTVPSISCLDSANNASQVPLLSKEKFRQLRKEIKEIRQQQKSQASDSGSDMEPWALASMLTSLTAVGAFLIGLTFWPLLLPALMLALVGLIFGFIALHKHKKNNTKGVGMTIAGILMGGGLLLFFTILLFLVFPIGY